MRSQAAGKARPATGWNYTSHDAFFQDGGDKSECNTMSAAGSIDESTTRYLNRVIGAHADHNRADFIFLRAQSAILRALPWETRLRPLRTWSELAIYSFFILVLVSTISLTAVLRL